MESANLPAIRLGFRVRGRLATQVAEEPRIPSCSSICSGGTTVFVFVLVFVLVLVLVLVVLFSFLQFCKFHVFYCYHHHDYHVAMYVCIYTHYSQVQWSLRTSHSQTESIARRCLASHNSTEPSSVKT